MDNRPSNDFLWIALIVMALLHLLVAQMPTGWLAPFTPKVARNESKDKGIEVEKWTDSQKPIVQSSKAPEDPEAKDKEARFAGEHRNRVKKETQSPLKGKFAEGKRPQGQGEANSKDGELPAGPKMSDLMPDVGASPHQLPGDVASGSQTVLNTDPVRYAGFINRIGDMVYDPWVRNANSAVKLIYSAGRKLDAQEYSTDLQVILNEAGEVTALTTLRSSGIDELDEATKRAFWEVEKFPNPPSQLFKAGVIKQTFTFIYHWKTSIFSVNPSQI